MNNAERTGTVLIVLAVAFCALALKFASAGRPRSSVPAPIPLVNTQFLDTATFRKSYVQLSREKADLSDFDCYACHEKGKPPTLRFDAEHNIVVPKEHEDVVMKHGTHNRNNNCFNCHDEQNLELLQARDGRQIKFAESPLLCGSCHGPTYRDWQAGAHGRTGGYWNRGPDGVKRQICVDCHNPHSPKIPQRKPAPGPHLLHPVADGGVPGSPKSEVRGPKEGRNPKSEAHNSQPWSPALCGAELCQRLSFESTSYESCQAAGDFGFRIRRPDVAAISSH